MTALQEVGAGFAEPVFAAQTVFRLLLDSMARPGTVAVVPADATTPTGFDPATTAVALTLFDFETDVWLEPAWRASEAEKYLRFHCGCTVVEKTQDAGFAVITAPQDMPRLGQFSIGSDQYPDTSATVLIQTTGLTDDGPIDLTGPGIKDRANVSVQGLPDWFWSDWDTNHGCFPTGIDLIFTAGDRLMCLPRSIKAGV